MLWTLTMWVAEILSHMSLRRPLSLTESSECFCSDTQILWLILSLLLPLKHWVSSSPQKGHDCCVKCVLWTECQLLTSPLFTSVFLSTARLGYSFLPVRPGMGGGLPRRWADPVIRGGAMWPWCWANWERWSSLGELWEGRSNRVIAQQFSDV